jgi:P-type Ca2+ transporter type 2C
MEAGLTTDEAARRQAVEGPNAMPDRRRRSLLWTALDVLREPMIALLLVCVGVYVALGDPGEAALLGVGILGIIMLNVVQAHRTGRALDALRDLAQPRAAVVRDGHRAVIPRAEVVRGDLALLSEGDRIPADGVLLDGPPITVDESLLTGESVAVLKRPATADDPPTGTPGGDGAPHLYAGTLVASGGGAMRVTAIGAATAMGRIGADLAGVEPARGALQRETRRLVRVVALGAVALSAAIAVAYGLLRGAWIDGALAALATAIALLPEEFPIVLTVFLAIGAFRIARSGVLTRRMAAVEGLGATTILCTDKTGTLTENRMRVRALWSPGAGLVALPTEVAELPEPSHPLVEHALLASAVAPTDAMEVALRALASATLSDTEHVHPEWALRREYPLSVDLLAMTRAWTHESGRLVREVSAKGSPEAVFDLCHLSGAPLAEAECAVADLAGRGWRVLGVARAAVEVEPLPDHQHDFAFALVGLVAFEDPLRPGVASAVARCREAGVRVLMITGDYPTTAAEIGRQAGLAGGEPVTGAELNALDDAALQQRLRTASVAARIAPSDKLRIVRALQASGEIVAMTGDGVNDAPALAAAQVGVAMGRRGSDVARESAALVLVDDDFDSLVGAMAHGRRIFDNLQKSMRYILAVHVPIAGLAAIPIFAGLPPLLLPVHVVLLELVIDPACALAFEAEPPEDDLMRRPPRDVDARLVDVASLWAALGQGLPVLAAGLGVYGWAWATFPGEVPMARSLAFASLMVGNVGLILANRSLVALSWRRLTAPNPVLPWVVAGALLVTLTLMYTPVLGPLLHFAAAPPLALLVAIGAGVAAFAVGEGGTALVAALRRRAAAARRGAPPAPTG